MSNTRLALPSGRIVGMTALGDPLADRFVVICHPTPGTSDFDPDPTITNRWGIHLIGLDRPGYGGSPSLPHGAPHSLRERADDIADLVAADERIADKISRADMHHFGVIGWGTGAIVGAAIAAQHPDRIDGLALVSAPEPAKAAKLARRQFAMPRGFDALHVAADDPAFQRHLGLRGRLQRMLEGAYTQGDAGIDADRQLIANTAWIRELRALDVPVIVRNGADDPTLDEDDLRWWQKHLAGVDARTVEGSAALTIADAWQEIVAHVAPQHGHIPEHLRDHGRPVEPELSSGQGR